MTLAELRTKPFVLVVAPNSQNRAQGELYLDDGESIDPPSSKTTNVKFDYRDGKLSVTGRFNYREGSAGEVGWKTVKFAGISSKPGRVLLDGRSLSGDARVRYDEARKVLEVDVNVERLRAFEVIIA